MLAAIYTRRGAARDVLTVRDVPDPEPGPGEVRVRLRMAGVNPTDWKARAAGGPVPEPGQIPGQDGAGEIDLVGSGVSRDRIGERVWVYHAAHGRTNGTAAQYTSLPAEQAVSLPAGISFEQGAGLGIPFITAHRCVFADGPVEGADVLITGGAGAVGNAAIQLARRGGARVIATVSSPDKAELARMAGAELVVDRHAPDVVEQIRGVAPGGIARVIDVALFENLESDLDVIAPHGVIVAYASGSTDPVVPVRRVMNLNVTVRFIMVYGLSRPMLTYAIHDLGVALEERGLLPMPTHRFPLAEIAAAHEAVEQHVVGKVLVELP